MNVFERAQLLLNSISLFLIYDFHFQFEIISQMIKIIIFLYTSVFHILPLIITGMSFLTILDLPKSASFYFNEFK